MSRYRDQVARGARCGDDPRSDPVRVARPPRRPLPAALEADARRRRAPALPRRRACGGALPLVLLPRPAGARAVGGAGARRSRTPSCAAALSAANCGRGSWEPGWTVDAPSTATCSSRCSGRLRARVRAARLPCRRGGAVARRPRSASGCRRSCRRSRPGSTRPSATRWPDARAAAAPSCACTGTSPAPARPRCRSRSPGRSTGREAPFRLKVADHPLRFRAATRRCCTWAPRRSTRTATTLLRVVDSLRAAPRAGGPGLHARARPRRRSARRTADGDGASASGAARSSPTAIVRAHEQGRTATAERLDAVAAAFAAGGRPARRAVSRPVARRPPCALTSPLTAGRGRA